MPPAIYGEEAPIGLDEHKGSTGTGMILGKCVTQEAECLKRVTLSMGKHHRHFFLHAAKILALLHGLACLAAALS